MTPAIWTGLAERAERGTGKDRELDSEIAIYADYDQSFLAGGNPSAFPEPLTSSVDAVLALIAEKLPGVVWRVGFDPDDASIRGEIITAAPVCARFVANADDPARALLAAFCRAMAALAAQPASPAASVVTDEMVEAACAAEMRVVFNAEWEMYKDRVGSNPKRRNMRAILEAALASTRGGQGMGEAQEYREGHPCGWPECGCDHDAMCGDAPPMQLGGQRTGAVETLPCEVMVAPATRFGRGVKLSTVLNAIRFREGRPASEREFPRAAPPPDPSAREARRQELHEIADGAYGDDPAIRGAARRELATLTDPSAREALAALDAKLPKGELFVLVEGGRRDIYVQPFGSNLISDRVMLARLDVGQAGWNFGPLACELVNAFRSSTLSPASVPAASGDEPATPDQLCSDCPPVDYPTDKMRCLPCPRRAPAASAQPEGA